MALVAAGLVSPVIAKVIQKTIESYKSGLLGKLFDFLSKLFAGEKFRLKRLEQSEPEETLPLIMKRNKNRMSYPFLLSQLLAVRPVMSIVTPAHKREEVIVSQLPKATVTKYRQAQPEQAPESNISDSSITTQNTSDSPVTTQTASEITPVTDESSPQNIAVSQFDSATPTITELDSVNSSTSESENSNTSAYVPQNIAQTTCPISPITSEPDFENQNSAPQCRA